METSCREQQNKNRAYFFLTYETPQCYIELHKAACFKQWLPTLSNKLQSVAVKEQSTHGIRLPEPLQKRTLTRRQCVAWQGPPSPRTTSDFVTLWGRS